MKLKTLLFGALVGVAFAACTNDNEPAGVAPVNGGDEVATTRTYLNISLAMPGNAATRAAADGFEYGTTEENTVTSGVLLFFEGTTQVADPFDLSNIAWTTDQKPTIEKISKTVVVLENPLKKPEYVVALLNADLKAITNLPNGTDDQVNAALKAMNLDELKKVVADFSATDEGKFVMSSSTFDGAVKNVGAEIEDTWDTYEDALKAPSVVIPVERVVAKVQTTQDEEFYWNLANATSEGGSNTVVIDGQEKELTAVIEGWWLDNTASTSLLLKSIDFETAPSFTWNDATNYRSYWAVPQPGDLNHGAFKAASEDPQYTQENVGDADKGNNNYNATQVVVAVTLKIGDDAAKLVKYSGTLYTEDGFAIAAANVIAGKYFTSTDGQNFTSVTKNDITITYTKTASDLPEGTTLKSYEAYAKVALNDYANIYEYTSTGYKKLTADPDLGGYVVQRWNNGMAYYFTPIVGNKDVTVNETVAEGEEAKTHPLYGVIRNHVYKVNVKSINGLGTPVPFSIEDEIIPIIPEDTETYISAEIDILAWKVVKQDVDLGK